MSWEEKLPKTRLPASDQTDFQGDDLVQNQVKMGHESSGIKDMAIINIPHATLGPAHIRCQAWGTVISLGSDSHSRQPS